MPTLPDKNTASILPDALSISHRQSDHKEIIKKRFFGKKKALTLKLKVFLTKKKVFVNKKKVSILKKKGFS